MPQDTPEGARWLSYSELAASRGISKASAIRMARRRKWLRREGNDGTTRVAVPEGEDQPKKDSPEGNPAGSPGGTRAGALDDALDGISHISKAFEAGLAALREQVQAERQRAERAEYDRDRLQEQLQRAEIDLAVERAASRSWLFRRPWRGRGG